MTATQSHLPVAFETRYWWWTLKGGLTAKHLSRWPSMKTNKIDVSCLMCHYSRESEIDHGFCMLLMKMTSTKNSNSFWRAQLTTFALLSAGYASYTYNRKSVSFVLPHLLKNGLLDKSSAGTKVTLCITREVVTSTISLQVWFLAVKIRL